MASSAWLTWRTRAYLFAMGLIRRMTFGTRILMVDGDRVFLVRHTYVPGWHFPGGGVEPGESAEDNARRETLEETGHVIDGALELFGFYYNDRATDRDHVILYITRSATGTFVPNSEIAEGRWYAIDALPDEASDPTRRRIDEVFHGVPRSDRW